jgi:hypothetical protein
VEAFGVLVKFKMVDVAMVTKGQKLLNLFQAYLVPLDVDVVPIKFHQFLFVPTMFHEV